MEDHFILFEIYFSLIFYNTSQFIPFLFTFIVVYFHSTLLVALQLLTQFYIYLLCAHLTTASV